MILTAADLILPVIRRMAKEPDGVLGDMKLYGIGIMKDGKRVDPGDVYIEEDGETLRIKEREE